MTATVKVYTRQFSQLDEFTSVAIQERSWLLNGVGAFTFQLGLSDPKNTAENIHVGNMVRVDSDMDCPPWVGRIDEFAWTDPDSVTVTCNSREALLRGPYFQGKLDSTAAIADRIKYYNNHTLWHLTGVTPGNIYSAVLPKDKVVDASGDLLDAIKSVADTLEAEFAVEHDTGHFNMLKKLGSDKTDSVWLEETDIIASPAMRVNAANLIWYCRVNGPQRSDGTGMWQDWVDEDIRRFVGGDVRQRVISNTRTGNPEVLLNLAKNEIRMSMKGLFTLDISINNTRNLASQFFLGDTIGVRVATFAWGMVNRWRVQGFAVVDEASPQIRLILQPENPKDLFPLFEAE